VDRHLVLAHELDVAWIIALWLAIHGGDPAPIEVNVEEVERIAESVLKAAHASKAQIERTVTLEQLQGAFKEMNIEVTRTEAARQAPATGKAEPEAMRPVQYCFKFRGKTYCITLPTVKPPPHV
jgi:hypothetical protein